VHAESAQSLTAAAKEIAIQTSEFIAQVERKLSDRIGKLGRREDKPKR
jgi:hypothetical protein